MVESAISPVLFTRSEAALRLRVSLGTLDRLIASGSLGVVRIGRKVLIRGASLDGVVAGLSVPTMAAMDSSNKHGAGSGGAGSSKGAGQRFLFRRRRRGSDGRVRVAACWSYTVGLPGGKAETVHTAFTRKDLAAAEMQRHRERLEEAAAGRRGSPWAGMSLAEIAEAIIERGGLKGSASAAWLGNWRTTVMLGLKATGWVVPGDADEHSWLAAWSGPVLGGYSSKYRNEVRAQVRALLARLVAERIIDRNPLADAPRDKRGDLRRKARAMAIGEVRAMVGRLPAFEADVVTLAYGAALRKADLRRLRIEWLLAHPDGGGLIVMPAGQDKSRRAATMRLTAWAWEAAQRLAAGRAEGLLIDRGAESAQWWKEGLHAAVAAAAAAAGLSGGPAGHVLSIGSARKTAITEAVKATADPRQVMDFARHSTMRMTLETYAGAGLSAAADVAMRLPAIGSGDEWTAGGTEASGRVGRDAGDAAGGEMVGSGGFGAESGVNENRHAGGVAVENSPTRTRTQGEVEDLLAVLGGGLLGGLTLRERQAVLALVSAEPEVRARAAELVLFVTSA